MYKITACVLFIVILGVVLVAVAQYDPRLQVQVMHRPGYLPEVTKSIRVFGDLRTFGPLKPGKRIHLFAAGHYTNRANAFRYGFNNGEWCDYSPKVLCGIYVSKKELNDINRRVSYWTKKKWVSTEYGNYQVQKAFYKQNAKRIFHIGEAWQGRAPKGGPWYLVVIAPPPIDENHELWDWFTLTLHVER